MKKLSEYLFLWALGGTLYYTCLLYTSSAFTFIYSKRTGTPAAVMEDQIPDDVVKDRFDRLLKEVQEISAEVCSCLLYTSRCV